MTVGLICLNLRWFSRFSGAGCDGFLVCRRGAWVMDLGFFFSFNLGFFLFD